MEPRFEISRNFLDQGVGAKTLTDYKQENHAAA